MAKILLFLIWPAGMAIIIGVAALLARRAPAAAGGPRPGLAAVAGPPGRR